MKVECVCDSKSGSLYCQIHGPLRSPESFARACYQRLCPYAPLDLPAEKSTTMTAYLEGYKKAVEDVLGVIKKEVGK